MKEAILAAVIGGTLAGAVSAGFVATFLATPPTTGTAGIEPLTGLAPEGISEETVGQLTRQLEELSMRLDHIESMGSQRVAAGPEAANQAELDDDLKDMLATLSTPGSAVDPLFQSKVTAALQRIEEEKEQAREQAEFERLQAEVDERLEKLQPELGLDGTQKNNMRTALLDERVRRNELMRSMREGGDFSREDFRTLRDETQTVLGGILTPAQMEAYESTQSNDRRRWGGGGDRGGDGGGNGGGGNGGGRGGGGNRGGF